jgi:hypothetical protein
MTRLCSSQNKGKNEAETSYSAVFQYFIFSLSRYNGTLPAALPL